MEMKQLTFEHVTDAHEIIKVIHAAFKRYETDPMPSSALAETPNLIAEEIKNGIRIFGAYSNNTLIGVIKVKHNDDHLYFSRLAVLPQYQGQGIASALVMHIENHAIKKKIARVICKVRKSETDNIRLYEKLGYSITNDELTTSPLGFIISTVTMEKIISV